MTRPARWLAVALTLAAPARAETLRDALAQAWAGNPALAAARARQEALAQTPEQARAAGRLTAAATGDARYDDLGYGRAATAGVNAALPIFTGGRVPAAVRAATADVAAGAQGLRDTEAAVLEQVVAVYAGLLFSQQAVDVAHVGIARLDRQVEESRSRFGLGQSTLTDVAQLEAQRASIVANLADAEGALATAQAAYRAIVGRDAGTLASEGDTAPVLPRTLADARAAAEEASPLLLANRRVLDASAARIDLARADGAPALDLTGGYGRGIRSADGGWRGFAFEGNAGVTLRVPLLTGGLVAARVRQAQANWRADRFAVDAAAREAVRGADSAWAALTAANTRLAAGIEGLKAADLALKGVRAEYGFGLRSTIDILIADQSFRAAQLDVARARSDVLVAQAGLLRATGRMTPAAYR
ncbi:TolC family protein [Sphingomonas corticis]|jgi:outer membrane protein|uniref:TolC family protein n=1 Tax=Sphingomonas corticis TaxID=2722791 RepID=A0ABX1CQJ0_9SPHN|nr:TolC family protein [Sphingomonas corticis]NJR78580.1 TolC family protein [Sphingomonas corticis]